MTTLKHSHAQWSSRMGFLLAATGSAVGLGNVWKFPYMAGQSGGSAFVLMYLVCIFLIGLPVLVLEWLIGRRGQKNPIHAMEDVAVAEGQSRNWCIVGFLGVLASFLILSFYSVIGGWALDYIFTTGKGAFAGMDGEQTKAAFNQFLSSPGNLLLWHTFFIGLTIAIVALGVAKGLERASKIMMPGLGILLLVLVGYSAFSTGDAFGQAMSFLFKPNWQAINGQVVLAALGHAFFTLSLGMGIMMSYGSYLGRDVKLIPTAATVVVLDTCVALLAGMTIFPLVFANHLEPSQGAGLIFVTLPIAFGNMPGGAVLGALFFIFLSFAALTSSMSLLEPSVELLEEKTHLNRKAATVAVGIAVWLLGIVALLSLNEWEEIKLFNMNIFDFLDYITSKFMLPIAGLGAVVFGGWFMNQDKIREELGLSSQFSQTVWTAVTRVIAPVGVIIVLIAGIWPLLQKLWALLVS